MRRTRRSACRCHGRAHLRYALGHVVEIDTPCRTNRVVDRKHRTIRRQLRTHQRPQDRPIKKVIGHDPEERLALSASSAANTDNPLPSLNRSLRTHRSETPSRTDNPAQNRSISSARYPTTTTTSSTPTSTRFRTARSNTATPATGTSGLTRPAAPSDEIPCHWRERDHARPPPSGQAAATEPVSAKAGPPRASGTPKTYRRRTPDGQHPNNT